MRAALAVLLLLVAAGCAMRTMPPVVVPEGSSLQLALLETTDLHSNVLSYDYYRRAEDQTLGFERVATLIRAARAEFPNSLLFDAGDTIQGTALADYQARTAPPGCEEPIAIYKAMNALGYDGGTLGNHEFNYGLPFLQRATGSGTPRCAGPRHPLVLSNVHSAIDGQPLLPPWALIEKQVAARAPDGSLQTTTLRIGLLGFVPPQIMQWDQRNLAGRVQVSGAVEAAQRYLPQLQAQRPDLIVALVHGGPDPQPYTPAQENPAWHLAGIAGIDAMLLGHFHRVFPGSDLDGMAEVDAARGLVRGVPAVMAGFWGKDLGIVHLQLRREAGRWQVQRELSHSEVRPICPPAQPCVAADPAIAPLVAEAHRATVAHLDRPIARLDFQLSSYFSDVGDGAALALVNAAQLDYVRDWIVRERPQWRDEPLLSAAAAFKTGFGGAADYTDVGPGDLSLRSAADLYLFSNQLTAVRIDGALLKRWLEASAQRYRRIDPALRTPQPLIDERSRGYGYDQFAGEGLQYTIDVSKPAGERIVDLRLHGRALAPQQMLIVATNNYRAAGGGIASGLDGSQIVLAAADENRDVVVRWLQAHQPLQRADLPPKSWRFAPLRTQGPVTFVSASGKGEVAAAAGLSYVRGQQMLGEGRSTYFVDLSP